MKTNKTEKKLSELIPTTLQQKYTVVCDQILGNTFALAKINIDYPLYINQGHDVVSNFYTKKEFKAFLMGMQQQIRIQNIK